MDGETSGALHTSDESGNEGFVLETQHTNSAGFLVQTERNDNVDRSTPLTSPGVSSSSSQPLAAVKEKMANESLPAVDEITLVEEGLDSSQKKSGKGRRSQKPETYSKGITWTRNFVCGPQDPVENRHSFYCMICNMSLSYKSKVAQEVLRHRRTEKHLRKDQRWRYEHLRSTDPITGRVRYEVRDRFG